MRCKSVCALMVDREAYVQGICEGVEHHLWSSDSCPAYRRICILRSSKPITWCTAVKAEGGGLLTEESVPGKVFAQIIIDRVCHHLLEHQRPEQSGFTPKRSTIDHILALRVLTECI